MALAFIRRPREGAVMLFIANPLDASGKHSA